MTGSGINDNIKKEMDMNEKNKSNMRDNYDDIFL